MGVGETEAGQQVQNLSLPRFLTSILDHADILL